MGSVLGAHALLGQQQRYGLSAYLHYLIAGHLMEFMLLHGPLARWCNEGVEAFNGQVKQRFFRHTQRGGHQGAGHAHGGGQVGKKIDGLSRWLLRRWYWTSGKA